MDNITNCVRTVTIFSKRHNSGCGGACHAGRSTSLKTHHARTVSRKRTQGAWSSPKHWGNNLQDNLRFTRHSGDALSILWRIATPTTGSLRRTVRAKGILSLRKRLKRTRSDAETNANRTSAANERGCCVEIHQSESCHRYCNSSNRSRGT